MLTDALVADLADRYVLLWLRMPYEGEASWLPGFLGRNLRATPPALFLMGSRRELLWADFGSFLPVFDRDETPRLAGWEAGRAVAYLREALAEAEAAFERDRERLAALAGRGDGASARERAATLSRWDRLAEARGVLEEAWRRDREAATGEMLADALHRLGEPERARAVLDALLADHPEHERSVAWRLMRLAPGPDEVACGEPVPGLDSLWAIREAAAARGDAGLEAHARLALAHCQLMSGNRAGACAQLRWFFEEDRLALLEPEALHALTQVAIGLGDRVRALALVRRQLREHPASPGACESKHGLLDDLERSARRADEPGAPCEG